MYFRNSLEDVLTAKMGKQLKIRIATPLSGGDINEAYRLETTEGVYCLKINRKQNALANFEAEAKGLNTLSDSAFMVPAPLHTGQTENFAFLLMDFIESGKPGPDYWDIFGRQLANLHRISHTEFGLGTDNFIGYLPQSNRRHPSWADFYAAERIFPLLQKAVERNLLAKKYLLSELKWANFFKSLFPEETPALLHGDLWAGNKMVSKSGLPVLIDPAVYFGHREMDLGMMQLFGGFDARLLAAYHEIYPLKEGWKSRIKWCQLYPLLVHLLLFGRSYASQVERILNDAFSSF